MQDEGARALCSLCVMDMWAVLGMMNEVVCIALVVGTGIMGGHRSRSLYVGRSSLLSARYPISARYWVRHGMHGVTVSLQGGSHLQEWLKWACH